jgi:NADH-quinone oxidoreductase subunit I
MNKVRKQMVCIVVILQEAITKAEERADEKHLCTEEKYSIYEINMLRCIGLCRLCPKDAIYLTTSKVLVPSSHEREDFIFGKDKLVMPLI